MPKLINWTPKEASRELNQRLRNAQDDRLTQDYRWVRSERIIYNTQGEALYGNVSYSFESDVSTLAGVDQSADKVGINYAFKNLRFVHAQLSANPPSVVPRPTSNDPEDRRSADAADRMVRFALREYNLQEVVDRASLNTLLYGTGITKTIWNPEKGEIIDFDEETGEMTMQGDFDITVPNIWNIYLDPDAETWEEVKFVFEKITIPYDEALFRWPDKADILERYRVTPNTSGDTGYGHNGSWSSSLASQKYDVVELYEYWEKGLPLNGYMGRFCICGRYGELITDLLPNPERYKSPKSKVAQAVLPYQIFTDLDVPANVWGKSVVEYETTLQDMLNRIDSVTLEMMQAHGTGRIILPESAEIADDSITNSPYDIIKYTGNIPPSFMEPLPMPNIIPALMDRYRLGIDDMAGVNESMFGQQSREQSGFSMQYATNQGNMIRRRLFNKYVLFVEEIYKSFLRIVQKHWKTPRTIQVLGKEKAFEAIDIKGADIDSGFDIVVEYGASLSLDPVSRREEIMTLMPLFEKAGVQPRQLLSMLKLNELHNMYDSIEVARDRQREIFEEMINTGIYIPPQELEDHKNMLDYAYYYRMTTEYKYLPEESDKALVDRHIKERETMAAAEATAPPGQQDQMASPVGPVPGTGPIPGLF